MMSGGAFIPLKTGRYRPESAKQAKIGIAILLRILRIGRCRAGGQPIASGRYGHAMVVWSEFRQLWLICPATPLCYLDHSLNAEIGAVSRNGMKSYDDISIHF
jgi:hypothetical protein